jgi:hypothetical protein
MGILESKTFKLSEWKLRGGYPTMKFKIVLESGGFIGL